MPRIKNTSPDGVALIPSAFLIEEIVLTNKIGETVDIQAMTTEFSITESLFSPTLFCSISVKDASNLLETFPIYGQETLRIIVYRQAGKDGPQQRIELEFYVTEYPLFGRPKEQHVQVYSIRGISPHAWKNSQMKISRFWEGPTADEITKIYGDAFGVAVRNFGGAISKGKGILNVQSPMKAADWLRRRTFDSVFSPFYLFQTADGFVNLKSHALIANSGVYETYVDSRDYNIDVATQDDYIARKRRIVDVASDLNLSKYFTSENGAFAAENNFLDIATKSFSKKFYSYTSDFPMVSTMEKTDITQPPPTFEFPPSNYQNVYSNFNSPPAPTIQEENVEQNFFAYLEHISHNSKAFEGAFQNYSTALSTNQSLGVLNAFDAVFNLYNHDLVLFGDMDLHAGMMVELEFPRAADPELTGKDNLIDENLSGRYLVTSAIHEFKDQEYYTKVRVKRDSYSKG